MSVINVKVSNIRPEYNNLKEWMKNKNNYYIGRSRVVFIDNKRFPEEKSLFANPFKIGQDGNKNNVIKKYKEYILYKLEISTIIKNEFKKLKNKNLGCWCKPEECQCHGDVLLELLDKYTIHEKFDGKCNICENESNEYDSWKCGFCHKIFCDEHNIENITCKCSDEFIEKIK
jgi:hypothetical protein